MPSKISIHALLAESDIKNSPALLSNDQFLSTLSLRRATRVPLAELTAESISIHALLAESDRLEFCDTAPHIYFYPRSPCGERPYQYVSSDFRGGYFYPRSPCGERHFDTLSALAPEEFLSTLSLRRATFFSLWCILCLYISIHALLAESDNGHETTLDRVSISIHALLAESDL